MKNVIREARDSILYSERTINKAKDMIQKLKSKQLKIKVEKPTAQKLKDLNVTAWPIWTKEPSTFDWHYDDPETCYFLEGDVTVDTKEGEVSFSKGDLVVFPRGLSCTWHVKKAVRKHYQFGQ